MLTDATALNGALNSWFERLRCIDGVYEKIAYLPIEDKEASGYIISLKQCAAMPLMLSTKTLSLHEWVHLKHDHEDFHSLYICVPDRVSLRSILPTSDEYKAIRHTNVILEIKEIQRVVSVMYKEKNIRLLTKDLADMKMYSD